MPRLGFAIDNRACIGCHACTVACKSEHEVPLGVNRTWVKYIEKGEFPNTRRFFNVQRCNHCEDAPCVEICPVTSLYQRPDGIVDFDPTRCIGCKACMQACPYDALYLDPQTNTAAKCNYCAHRVEAGYEPACVVVCPVEAIVSGDLDDPNSRISQLDRMHHVQYPKPEKGTKPKLFYVGGEAAALDPAAAPPSANYLWSGNDGRISLKTLQNAQSEAEIEAQQRAKRVYDPASKPAPWGWMVSAYITTKAIAAGAALAPFLIHALRISDAVLPTSMFLVSVLFLALTGALLVADLKQPMRFLSVLLRPQWRSWLVRGAYLITAFSLLLPVAWGLGFAGSKNWWAQHLVGWILAFFAASVAMYTAFLFAQAKGRDYWQNPLLAVSMLADALAAGVAVSVLAGLFDWQSASLHVVAHGSELQQPIVIRQFWKPPQQVLLAAIALLALLTIVEFVPKHPNRNAEQTAKSIIRGPFARWFWGGVVGVGLLAPAVLLLTGGSAAIAGVLLIAGIACKNHVMVQAPQRVPLS